MTPNGRATLTRIEFSLLGSFLLVAACGDRTSEVEGIELPQLSSEPERIELQQPSSESEGLRDSYREFWGITGDTTLDEILLRFSGGG